MKKHIQIKNTYKIWNPAVIKRLLARVVDTKNYTPLIIEWWVHNLVYWFTKPFTFIPAIKRLNIRARDTDLDVEVGEQ